MQVRRRCLALAVPFLAVTAVTPWAVAQSEEFTLSDDRDWVMTDAPEPGTDEAIIAEARRALADERPGRARTLMDDFIEANRGEANPWLPAAFRLRGDALVAMDQEYLALYDYETVAKEYPGSEEFRTTLRRELDIAHRYANGLKIRAFGMRFVDGGDLAIELYIRTHERTPGSELGEEALISLADYYYAKQDMVMASESYDLYLYNYPGGPNRLKAFRRRIYADIIRFKGPDYDSTGLVNAQVQIRDFADRFPADAAEHGIDEGLATRIEESLAAQYLKAAEWYLGQDDDPSARYTIRRLVREYPDSIAATRGREIAATRGWDIEPAIVNEAIPANDDATVVDDDTETP